MTMHLIPTPLERQQLFYWLKKASSYTAWSRVERYHGAWVAVLKQAYDESVRNPHPVHGPLIHASDLSRMLYCQSCIELGVEWLLQGRRDAFVWLGRKGHFSEAGMMLDYWREAEYRHDNHDNEITVFYSPLAPQFRAGTHAVLYAWIAGGIVTQTREMDVPALIGPIHDEGDLILEKRCRFPPGPLPEVPVPPETVLVPTGAIVPCFGVWEPVKADLSPGFVGLFKKPIAPPSGEFKIDGCMNYLHGGHPAPTIWQPDDEPRYEGRPTVWRLIWEDTRYTDGVVPDEERDYLFFDIPDIPDITATSLPEPTASSPAEPLIYARSGEPAPKAGRWAVLHDAQGWVELAVGDVLPLHRQHQVEWVWSGKF